MTSLILNVLATASLLGAGIGATSETRSAQALPTEHLAGAHAPATSSRNVRSVNRLADASPDTSGSAQSDEDACKHNGGHWDAKDLRCVRRVGFWDNPATLLIGAGTIAGIVVAITSSGNSVSN